MALLPVEVTQTLITEGSESLAGLPLWNCYCCLYSFPRAAGTNKKGSYKQTKIQMGSSGNKMVMNLTFNRP